MYLPSITLAPCVDDFVEECSAFPKGAYDDQLDAASQAIRYLLQRITAPTPCIVSRGWDQGERELEGEDLWEKAKREPLTEEEIDRLR